MKRLAKLVLAGGLSLPGAAALATEAAELAAASISARASASAEAEVEAEAEVRAGERLSLPSISAVHVRHHEPSDVELLRADIEYSRAGLRVRQRDSGAALEMIQNFASGQAWLVDGERRIAHELPIEDDVSVEPGEPEPGASFLGSVPCEPAVARADGQGSWRAREVDAFTCLDDDGAGIAVEFIDREFGLVVYRRSTSGRVDELRNIRRRQYAAGHFEPAARYRPVDKREMFNGVPEIEAYVESE